MSKRVSFWLMVLNGIFILLNAGFMAVNGDTVNLIAGLVCVAGFASALNNYLNVEQ